MDLKDFLSAVTPPGNLIVATLVERAKADGEKYKVFSHTIVEGHDGAVDGVNSLLTKKADVYYALASYKQGFFLNDKNKKVVRVRSNVDQLKAIWFDVDYKAGYPDAAAVVEALKGFCKGSGMPPPSILVGSGNGVHVYWPLDEAIPVDRWLGLANAAKEAAKALGLKADLACTADACRVLRPPFTFNYKDPTNPKPVGVLYSSGKSYPVSVIEAALTPWIPVSKPPISGLNSDLSGGLGSGAPARPSSFVEIQKHCGVAKHFVDSHGKDATEPEWVAALQLLKHCEDGPVWVHPISDGHAGYTHGETENKWAARQANSVGPTLCKTFELYQPKTCAKCPHNGFIKTPLQVGYEGTQDLSGFPPGWRVAADKSGVERLFVTDVTANIREWIKVMRHIPSNFRPVRSIVTGQYEMMLDVELRGTGTWTVSLPMSMLGNPRKLVEALASYGVVLKEKELKAFGDLMATWLEKLQSSKRVADVAEQLGWMYEGSNIIGFSCSPTTYYADGRIRNDVRPAKEFAAVAKLYEPRGELEEWKKVAKFLADQNSPGLTSILAAGFGSPLLKFTGLQGGILAIVSAASGVGKSSALKCSQAIWGSPTHAVNSVDDTPKSVGKKLGFLHNLPAYWDELRGKQTVDGFTQLAFQITQGKEKSRLDSNAHLKEVQTWETMLVVASNESIFEAMSRRSLGTDAGMVRTFEMVMDKAPLSDMSSADITLMFERISTNYGQAGREYAAYIATHQEQVRTLVQEIFSEIASTMEAQERFWYGMVAAILAGAAIASKIGLVQFDLHTMKDYLLANIVRLRGRTTEVETDGGGDEVLAAFMRERGDRTMFIDEFLAEAGTSTRAQGYSPMILSPPRADKVSIVVAQTSGKMRFTLAELKDFLRSKEQPTYGIIARLSGARELRCQLALGTKYEMPRTRCVEVTWAGSGSPEQSPDSSPSTAPAGSTES